MNRTSIWRRLARLGAVAAILVTALTAGAPPPAAAHPAPSFPAECPWMDTRLSADQRAHLLLTASTLDQKLRWLNEQAANSPAQTSFNNGAVTFPAQVPCTPTIQYTDGPAAVSGAGTGVTAFPAQITLASTWDRSLASAKGLAQAKEAFGKHRNVVLGPGLFSGRVPMAGRTSEYLGEDPILGGLMAASIVRGIQANPGSESVIKHYVANEQELDRNRSSSNVDARTLREIYTLPFEIAIREGKPGGVMCAFNQVNGVWSCEDPTILRQILKQEIGFDGWVVSDFFAVHTTGASIAGGLDQELNRPRFITPDLVHAALAAGEISEAQIDDAAFRVVRAHFQAGLFDVPLPVAPADVVTTPAAQAIALREAEEGSVLLKNTGGTLPLRGGGKTIAVIGPTASNNPTNGISAASVCAATAPSVPCTPVAPFDAIAVRAAADGDATIFDNGSDPAAAARTAQAADIAIVFGYYREGEFNDRPDLALEGNGDALIAAVGAANPNTIVVLQTGGAVLMPWLGSVDAVLETWYGGQQMGTAVAALLWGDVNPSGKLPITFPASAADLPTAGSPAQYPGVFADGSTTRPAGSTEIRQVSYPEGLKVGYRWYDAQGIAPLFAFGHGLSYTSFDYRHLRVSSHGRGDHASIRAEFTIRNTGHVSGTETAQVYVTLPAAAGEPPLRLVGWQRVTLRPGEHRTVAVEVEAGDASHPLSWWDAAAAAWTTPSGVYGVSVGGSSRDLSLTDEIRLR